MKRAYYAHYYRNFGNTYNLYWAPDGEAVPESWERITRKAAISVGPTPWTAPTLWRVQPMYNACFWAVLAAIAIIAAIPAGAM